MRRQRPSDYAPAAIVSVLLWVLLFAIVRGFGHHVGWSMYQ